MCQFHSQSVDICTRGSSSRTSSISSLHILDLPPEIHLHILQYLDFQDLDTLVRTNQYLRSIITPARLRQTLKSLERESETSISTSTSDLAEDQEQQLPSSIRHRGTDCLPCYYCFQLLDIQGSFSADQTTGNYALRGYYFNGRRCMSCAHSGKPAFIDRKQSEIFYEGKDGWIDCRLCCKTRRYRDDSSVHREALKVQGGCSRCWLRRQGQEAEVCPASRLTLTVRMADSRSKSKSKSKPSRLSLAVAGIVASSRSARAPPSAPDLSLIDDEEGASSSATEHDRKGMRKSKSPFNVISKIKVDVDVVRKQKVNHQKKGHEYEYEYEHEHATRGGFWPWNRSTQMQMQMRSSNAGMAQVMA